MTRTPLLSRLLLSFALLLSVVSVSAPTVAAVDPFQTLRSSKCGGRAAESTICQTRGTDDPLVGTIRNIAVVISFMAGTAAVVVMVLAGIRYITSGGDPDQVGRAKKAIIYGAVGLIVIILAQVIINAVLNRI